MQRLGIHREGAGSFGSRFGSALVAAALCTTGAVFGLAAPSAAWADSPSSAADADTLPATTVAAPLNAVAEAEDAPDATFTASRAAAGLGVEVRSEAEVRDYFTSHAVKYYVPVEYVTNKAPNLTEFSHGVFSADTENAAVELVNFIRYTAGLDALHATNAVNTGAVAQCQNAALMLARQGVLPSFTDGAGTIEEQLRAQYPQPEGLDATGETNYALGIKGLSRSVATGAGSLQEAIMDGWLYGSDTASAAQLGHRRQLLNPALWSIAFGAAQSAGTNGTWYYVMDATDKSNTQATQVNVAWPTANTPVQLFRKGSAWTLSLGTELSDEAAARVSVTVSGAGKQWTFTPGSGLTIDNTAYGQPGCLAFTPADISTDAGSAYTVSVSGLSQAVQYSVSFFDLAAPLEAVEVSPDAYDYIGEEVSPSFTVSAGGIELREGIDYQLTKKNWLNANSGSLVRVEGRGRFAGMLEEPFTIKPASLKDCLISGIKNTQLTSAGAQPTCTVEVKLPNGRVATLKEGLDYLISFKNNTTLGATATLTITGKGNYTGSASKTFVVTGSGNTGTSTGNTSSNTSSNTSQPAVKVTPGWKMTNGKWWYQNADGTYPRSAWKTIDGKRYHFDAQGYLHTDWRYIDSSWYFLGTDGAMRTKWVKSGGNWYWLGTNGKMTTQWKQIANKWYYFGYNGKMRTGWQRIGSDWYCFKSDGAMRTGWVLSGKSWYYLQKSGAMAKGWTLADGKYYYMNRDGVMQTGWLRDGSKWYWLGTNGVMRVGWIVQDGKYRYFKDDGSMAVGWTYVGDTYYYFDTQGYMTTESWIGDYYVGKDGAMAKNTSVGGVKIGADGKRLEESK